ncbi:MULTISPECIES: FxsA family protein [Natrinema]|uniref:Membrane protein FxsA n=3 Tax=Natrinema TaxID=88723 RepID=A0A482Y451_9EURY|nr:MULTISPECIES: FxsA family protein [Natrinema]ELY82552.1 phage T7 F exclusion suppressor FxsA [Natrinema pallidum DSM 3751]QCW04604.1 membrane protein FxsA [Natrinema pallidum]RZH69203.1 membrane protein FxsA [Natrinema altunense]
MLRWIFALLLIPFLDAVLLAVIVTQFGFISWVGMVLLVVLTGLVGMLLVRAEGRRTIRKMQRTMAAGQPPTNELLDGGLLIAAGAFLLTPGLVTDVIGFLLAVPLTRIPIRAALKRFVIVPYADKKTGGFASGTVWTFGFPDDETAGNATESTNSGTYDLGDDAYTVDENDDSYTIDFGDEHADDADDERDDDPLAR